jgi:hypothetical protein
LINRDGSCADCHANPLSTTSQGPIYVAQTSSDGGTP